MMKSLINVLVVAAILFGVFKIYEAYTNPRTIVETFRGEGPGWLRTSGGTYELHQMSTYGYVESVKNGVAEIKRPNGKPLTILTKTDSPAAPPPAVVEATPTPPSIVIADSVSQPGQLTKAAQEDMAERLAKPVGPAGVNMYNNDPAPQRTPKRSY